jgi:capsular exopolysaccharide synthesis family protein
VASSNRQVTPGEGTIVPSLLDYLRVLGRWKLVFLLILVLVPATAVASSLRQAPTYQASAEVLLDSGEAGVANPDPQRVAQTRAQLARVPAVVDQVLEEVPSAGLDQTEFLESSSVSTTLGSDLLTFSVKNSDPRLARELATEYASAFTEYQQQLDNEAIETMLNDLEQQLAALQANGDGPGSPNYDTLERRRADLAAAAAAETRSARVVNPAREAPKVGPRTVRNGLIAFCLGLVLALVVVFLADALDTRVRSVDSIREALGLPLLGRLAPPSPRLQKANGLVMLADPTSGGAEQFRALRANLDLANAEHGARTIMITSAVDAEGKSTTVANLAVALARAGRRVILIDADLSRPHLHRLFGLDQWPGLTDLELGEARLEEALRTIGLTVKASERDHQSRRMDRSGSLELLPGGSVLEDPDELGFENAVGRVIQLVRDRADVVLVDAPPLMSHAIALGAHVDAVVVVVRLKALRTSTLQDLSRILAAMPVTKLGFIVTGVDRSEGYGQHARYAASTRRSEAKPRLTLAVPPSAAKADGEAGESPNEPTGESEAARRGPAQDAVKDA